VNSHTSLPPDFFAAFGATPRHFPSWDGTPAGIWALLAQVPDPEIPVISLVGLGVIREVTVDGENVEVVFTPTYAGCPATEVIKADISAALMAAGVVNCRLRMQLSPAWTTDWISPDARTALREYGIAPPASAVSGTTHTLNFVPACPRCGSRRTERLSAFGATPCKALHRCLACAEPFDYFKPL
jgi:ring-1,2-phenylacetyl-CoA epoxidase subunit PaaD